MLEVCCSVLACDTHPLRLSLFALFYQLAKDFTLFASCNLNQVTQVLSIDLLNYMVFIFKSAVVAYYFSLHFQWQNV